MSESILEYRAVLFRNSETFLYNYAEEFNTFGIIDRHLDNFLEALSTKHMRSGRSLVSFVPVVALIQRQYRNAFQAFSVFQSYQGWQIVRPAIESALIMGKWLDDRDNVEVWKRQREDWKAYNKVYLGKNLVSAALPESEAIRGALSAMNDDYMHANPSYYHRHSEVQEIDEDNIALFVNYFDSPEDHRIHLYAFLHLTCQCVHSIGTMLGPLYEDAGLFAVDLEGFRTHFGARARTLSEDHVAKKALLEIGLWPEQLFT